MTDKPALRKCERCAYAGHLYFLGTKMLCSGCWDVVASDEAQAQSLRQINLRDKRPVPFT